MCIHKNETNIYYIEGGYTMYYYGGYQGYGCGCGAGYPMVGGCGAGYGAAIVLVLFILLVIVIGARSFGPCGH